ncbi:MAG: YDG domain-containing protein [Holosporaceae bacterium]
MQRARFLSADFGRSALVLQLSAAILTAIFFAGITAESAHANPADGVVAAGSATISESGKKLDVHQASDRAVIDWRSFNIDVDEHTQFHQPSASAVAVNRVNSNDPSQIMGRLSANGNVVLINPNGVFFGRDSRVDVNGLIATTADVDNNQVMQGGKLHFTKPGKPTATITNQGTITAKQAGLVGLVAPNVENDGVIAARLGKVQLASGDQMTVDLYGDGLMELAVSDTVEAQLVKNTGTISAEGGTIALTAAAGREIVNSLVQIEGELTAPTVAEHNGKIIIAAEGGNATILAGGQIKASGEAAGTTGGTVRLEADRIAVTGKIDASGKAGGGKVFVGGDYLGGKPGAKKYADTPIKNAKAVVVTDNASIDVSAKDRGNGGTAIVWSDDYTNFAGTIHAMGGAMGGDGGFVETSSKDNLQSSGLVDAAAMAPGYQAGTWLLDPRNLTISSSTTNGAFDNGSPNIFTPTGDSATVLNTTINSALNNGTTVILNTGSTGTQAGDITIGADISKTSGGDAGLILRAAGSILNSGTPSISSTSGKLHVKLNSDSDNSGGGAIALSNMSITTNGGNLSMGGGNLASQQAINAAYSQADYDNASVALLDTAKGLSGRVTGINLSTSSGTSTYNTGAGSLSLLGKGWNSGISNHGVVIGANTTVQTDSGALTITGTGGNGTHFNHGVLVSGTNARITSATGAVTVEGVGGNGSGNFNVGTYLFSGGQITSTGSATLSITGTGGNGTSSNQGVRLQGTNTLITSLNGAVTVTGVGGNGTGINNYGTHLNTDGQITSTGSATLTIKGTGGGTGASSSNHGILLHTTTTSIASSTGSILLYGTPGVNSSFGITTAGTTTLGSATQTGNIELYSDSWGTAPTNIRTQGQVIFAPLTAGNSIGLNSGAGTVSIPNSWIAAINTVAPSKLVLGRSTDGSGAVTIGSGWNLTASGTVGTLVAGNAIPVEIYGGSITTGNITAGSKSLLLQARTGNITLLNSTINNTGSGGLSLTAGNQIATQSAGSITTNGGNISFSATNGIVLNHALNLTTNGGNLSFANNLTLGASQSWNTAGGTTTFGGTVNANALNVLAVGGGGSGGGNDGGGGGAGGMLAFRTSNVSAGNTYSIVVGAGGVSSTSTSGNNGGNTTAFGATAAGGGGGGGYNAATTANVSPLSGGSGGGANGLFTATSGAISVGNSLGAGNTASATYIPSAANGTGIYGNAGGSRLGTGTNTTGGGGGAGASGIDATATTAGKGGDGIQSNITGTTYYSGGGGGGAAGSTPSTPGGAGGLGGGGGGTSRWSTGGAGGTGGETNGSAGANATFTNGGNAAANTGGGGGGGVCCSDGHRGGNGGSGIVVIRYSGPQAATGGTVTTVGGDTVHSFKTTGTTNFVTNASFMTGGLVNLTLSSGSMTFGGAIGGTTPLGTVSLTSTNSLSLPSINAASILARTTGATSDIALASGSLLTASDTGNAITLASARNFINNAGSGALSTPNGRWLVYSTNPANDTIGSLSNSFRRFSCTYGGSCPSFPATGNGFLYSYTPTLTITPTANAITYGDAAPNLVGYAYGASGYLASDATADTLSGSLTGTTIYTQGSNVGTYNINYGSGSLTSAMGYGFTYANNSSAITVNPRVLTAALTGSVSKTYDRTTAATLAAGNYSLSNIYGSDDVTLNNPTGTYDTANVGTGKTVSVSGLALTGTKAGNYSLAATSVSGNVGAITARALSITANNKTMTYGDGNSFNGYSSSGLVAGDSISAVDLATNASLSSASQWNAGNWLISAANATGSGLSNYSIAYNTGTLSVGQKALSIAGLSGVDKVYDRTTTASLSGTGSLSGLVTGDSVSLDGTATTANFANANVGTAKAITVAGYSLGGADSGNYSLSQPTGLTANITARALSITANNKTMTYGDGNSFNGYSSSGLVAGDSIGAVDLATNASLSGAGQWNAGNWLISAANATGSGLSNYSIAYNTGTLSVGKRSLSGSVNNQNLTYGAATPSYGKNDVTWSGFYGSDSVANLTSATIDLGGYSQGSNAGSYTLSLVSANLGSLTGNYQLGTFTPGILTVGAVLVPNTVEWVTPNAAAAKPTESKTDTNTDSHAGTTDKMPDRQADPAKSFEQKIPMLLIDPALARRLGLQAQLFEQLTMPIRKTLPINKWFEKSSQIMLASAV